MDISEQTDGIRYFHSPDPFPLERGGSLPGLTVAYHTFGTPAPDGGNTVWVCHALTASSDVVDWWPRTVEEGRFLDPSKYFIVCANILGSCYGTTGPLSEAPDGKPYYGSFPLVTMSDIVAAHRLLADHLGIGRIHALVGSSVGGFQALEWIAAEPDRFDKLILIATEAKASPWAIAIDETQRMAILADSTYGLPAPDAGRAGLAAARAIGLLTYRGGAGYNLTQQDPEGAAPAPGCHRPCTYQRHQGEKLCRRFNAYSYMSILNSFDTHDIGRARGGIAQALSRVKADTVVIGISSDMIFPPADMRRLCAMIPGARYAEIDSEFGHDGFLVEHDRLNAILLPFMNR